MDYSNTPAGKDPQLWDLAKRRASFKSHMVVYIVVNIFLWAVWFFSKGGYNSFEIGRRSFPWPAWPTLGWGIGLAFHYIGAYVTPQNNSAEAEYEKLIQQKSKQ